jgi:CubicO group peptidase (beta-lactamase class C family)
MYVTFRRAVALIVVTLFLGISIIPAIQGNVESQTSPYEERLLDLNIKMLMRLGHFPSLSVCIIKNDRIVWYNGYGRARFLTKPNIDTVYRIHSISKTFTATALMQLYQQGHFDLDDNINDYLDFEVYNPNYPDVNITFRMLLAHQSSLTNEITNLRYFYYNSFCYVRYKKEYVYPFIKELITPNGKLYKPMTWENYPPGKYANYSNVGMMLNAYLVEVMSGQSFHNYVRENIFEPLNMTNSSFYYKDFKRNQLAVSYYNIGNLYLPIPYIDLQYGAVGIKTSIQELSHYAIAHMNNGTWNGISILNESNEKLMHSVQYNNSISDSTGDPIDFGLGWHMWPNSGIEGHFGHGLGGTTAMMINSSKNYSILFFINSKVSYSNPIVLYAWDKLIEILKTKANSY